MAFVRQTRAIMPPTCYAADALAFSLLAFRFVRCPISQFSVRDLMPIQVCHPGGNLDCNFIQSVVFIAVSRARFCLSAFVQLTTLEFVL